ncbi:Retrovirus-related Pol polyprotein from transposon TNT 1-94 [Dendrobium catenatum]|uniref:Retrovirus-related Pol polyprotein from transposon TNT 1-94 n=1 Tax=Dendrobium catenatum TaxID=906689 RepID=A0A2I0WDP9_9ASPA|nr:Retrovirus-related Pol polyprotein from transposon TNT 1-94 [Dendrobium catenatum]
MCKSDVFIKFTEFHNMISQQFDAKIKTFRSDGGGEFLNNQFQKYFRQLGIQHQYTCPYTPAQNGVAERKHRHILETVRTLLTDAHLPHVLWVEALLTAVYLINRLPTRTLNNISPYHCLFRKPPSYNHLKIFGSLCYPWLKPYQNSKLSPISTPCVFIGYSSAQKGYRCLNPQTGKVFVSRHVIFNESIYPYLQSTSSRCANPSYNYTPPLILVPTPQQNQTQHNTVTTTSPPATTAQIHSTSTTPTVIEPTPSNPAQTLPTHPMTTRSKTGNLKPKKIFNLLHTHPPPDPTTYHEAAKQEHWRRAMSDEFQALQTQGTWILVPPNSNQNVLGCKWTFRTKLNSDGTPARYKARLVAKGFNQEYGLDYDETFSPVAKMMTIRILLSLAIHHEWPIRQLDVSNAFLHGSLNHTVYMKQPIGFVDTAHPDHVCQLKKALYGLKQSPREWFSTLSGHLHSLGFRFSNSDTSLLLYHHHNVVMYFLVYVDDIILTGNNQQEIQKLINNLSAKFAMKDLGPISQFLGIHVVHTTYGLHLNQQQFANTILSRAGMTNSKPVSTPFQLKKSNHKLDSNAFCNPSLYRQIAGSLQYLTLTRPDIAFAVNKVCQHMQNPTNHHFEAIKRLLRYIKGTIHIGLPLFRDKPTLRSYVDSDWAGDDTDRKSTSGFCNYLGSSLISWSVKKQTAVARSSTEAEYRAIASAATEIVWIRHLLQELQHPQQAATQLFCDNTSAIALANNPVFHARTKHIEVDCHYIRNCIKDNTIQVHHISTKDQLADVFTKPLPTPRFNTLISKLVTSSEATT